MNNKELVQMFAEIAKIPNTFDRYVQLKNKKKEYKKSEFYKATHMPMLKAYQWMVADSVSAFVMRLQSEKSAMEIGDYISDILDNITPESVENLTQSITSFLDISNMVQSTNELGAMVSNLIK